MEISKYIMVDPNICHGKPCFRGTRVMVYLVLELLASGETPEEIIRNAYPRLTKKHIEAALEYAAQVAREGSITQVPLIPYAFPR